MIFPHIWWLVDLVGMMTFPIYDGKSSNSMVPVTTQPDYMMGKIMVLPFGNQCFNQKCLKPPTRYEVE